MWIEKHYVKKTIHKSLHKICEINGYMKYDVKQMIQMINFSIIFDDNNMIKSYGRQDMSSKQIQPVTHIYSEQWLLLGR